MAFTTSNGRTRTAMADINITPLVDVVLVLLLIFMLTAPVLQSGIQVAVPKTRTVNELTQQRTVITINRDSQVFLDDAPINIADIPARLKAIATVPAAQQTIYLRADTHVNFGDFASVMDAVKQSGVTNISIVTQPLEH